MKNTQLYNLSTMFATYILQSIQDLTPQKMPQGAVVLI